MDTKQARAVAKRERQQAIKQGRRDKNARRAYESARAIPAAYTVEVRR